MASSNEPNNEGDLGNDRTVLHKNPGVILVVVLVVVIIFAVGVLAGHVSPRVSTVRFSGSAPGEPGVMASRFGGPRFTGSGPSKNQDSIEGVVTSVNGATLTVAGDGATNTVVTTSSTQYEGGSQPKVNDTVIASGTISNDTFTATQITINP